MDSMIGSDVNLMSLQAISLHCVPSVKKLSNKHLLKTSSPAIPLRGRTTGCVCVCVRACVRARARVRVCLFAC